MFTLLEDYDVQATRREAHEEGMIEGELKSKLEDTINIIKEINLPLSRAMSITKLQENNRSRLVEELTQMGISFTD
jgi:hypothetical protein